MHSLRVVSLWALGALALVTTSTLCSAQSFEIKRYDGIYNGMAISRGDFNNDGIQDVIATGSNGAGNGFVVFLGNADGTFRPGIAYSMADQVNDLTVRDFNHDGKLDVAVISPTNSAYIIFGKGDGTFQTPVPLGTKYTPSSIIAADFNNDGKLDLAVAESNYNPALELVEIFEGQGDGTFNRVGEYDYNDSYNTGIKVRVGDFNGDGKTDIALMLFHSMNVLWGAGNGTFQTQQVGTYVETNDMNTGDINQDGKTDIVLSYFDQIGSAPTQSQRLGKQGVMVGPLNGGVDAYFGTASQQMTRKNVVGSQYESPTQLWAVDVDGDGINDIVALDNNENWHDGLYIWMGNPDGSFQQTPKIFTYTTDRDKIGMVTGDFNRDGRVDFVALRDGTGSLETLMNATPRSACHSRTDTESITVCQPNDYTFSNSPIHDIAKATGNNITAMQIYVDNQLVKTNSGSNMDAYLALGVGDHFIVNKAWDALGHSFRSDRHVTIFNGGAGQTCGTNFGGANDTLNVCLPQNNGVDKGSIRVFANAYTETAQTSMQVYIDNQLKLSDSSSSFVDQTYTESAGQHYVVVKAWDADGHNVSKSVVVTVQ